MLLSLLDPALLIYKYEDWQVREVHCFDRFEALTLHRRIIREFDQKIAMSIDLAGLIYQFFPWSKNFSGIDELRDFRQFILEELQRADYIDSKIALEIDLQPNGIVSVHVEASEVLEAWKELLCGCVDESILTEFDPQIATWETEILRESSEPMMLTIHDSETKAETHIYKLPLVWDDNSWAMQLATQEWWPDLHRCVELHFRTNRAMRDYAEVREEPIPFETTNRFRSSVERYCNTDHHLRGALIAALTKKVYGILDAGLGDESFKGIRRFRVTDFWRVHYREDGNRIVLEQFGRHSIGGAN
jgi:hypothetical protein